MRVNSYRSRCKARVGEWGREPLVGRSRDYMVGDVGRKKEGYFENKWGDGVLPKERDGGAGGARCNSQQQPPKRE